MNENKRIIHLIDNLFYDSKFFLLESKKKISDKESSTRFIKASILLSWAGFEGWINKSCMDFSKTFKEITIHEKAFLIEKKVELKKGEFTITNSDKYESTENKIEFLINTIAKSHLDKSNIHWMEFKEIKIIRDSLVHPKIGKNTEFNIKSAEKTIKILLYYINLLSKKLYNKSYKI